jgi:hypothetical protein
MSAHPHRQNYTPEPAPASPARRTAFHHLGRYAVYTALLMGAVTVGAVLAGVLP